MDKGTVTPYVAAKGADRFLDFVEAVFTGEKAARVRNADGTVGHAEIRIGDSIVMAFDSRPEWPPTPAFLSVYVKDSDAVVERALEAGATLVTEVTTSGIVVSAAAGSKTRSATSGGSRPRSRNSTRRRCWPASPTRPNSRSCTAYRRASTVRCAPSAG